MIFTCKDIERDVRVALDQNDCSDALAIIEDVDTLSLNDIIHSKILEAVKKMHNAAPAHLLHGGHNFGDAICWKDKECGFVILPDDFMRLIVFRMSDWERPVYKPILESDSAYQYQSSRFKGLRGTSQKPVCALLFRPEGKILEFYSCKSNDATVSQAAYLPYPKIDEYGGVDICERCYKAVVYMIASLTLLTIGEIEKSTAFSELAKSELV